MRSRLEQAIEKSSTEHFNSGCHSTHTSTRVDVGAVVTQVYSQVDRDMVHYSCDHLLDCVLALYKVSDWQRYNQGAPNSMLTSI